MADPRLGVTSAESISGGTAADEKTSSVSGTALMEAIELTTAGNRHGHTVDIWM